MSTVPPISPSPTPKFTLEDVVTAAVENPRSYYLGAALAELMRYREGAGNIDTLTRSRAYIERLMDLEKTANSPRAPLT